MIKIKETTKEHLERPLIIIDEYILLEIDFQIPENTPLVYWRFGDGVSSIIEFSFHQKSGLINSITLTSIPNDLIELNEQELSFDLPVNKGSLIVDLSLWNLNEINAYSNSFKDDFNESFRFIVGKNELLIMFDNAHKATKAIKCGQVLFGISDAKKLSFLMIINVKLSYVKKIKNLVNPIRMI